MRFDKHADLLEQAKGYCKKRKINLIDLVARGLELAMASHFPDDIASHENQIDIRQRLATIESRLAELTEVTEQQDMTSQRLADGLTQERIEEIIDQRVAYLIDGMNQIKADVENQLDMGSFQRQENQISKLLPAVYNRHEQSEAQSCRPHTTD